MVASAAAGRADTPEAVVGRTSDHSVQAVIERTAPDTAAAVVEGGPDACGHVVDAAVPQGGDEARYGLMVQVGGGVPVVRAQVLVLANKRIAVVNEDTS